MITLLLFLGGFAQWLVAGLSTRYLSRGRPVGAFLSVVGMQAIWYANVGPAATHRDWRSMAAWSLGCGLGALLSIRLTRENLPTSSVRKSF